MINRPQNKILEYTSWTPGTEIQPIDTQLRHVVPSLDYYDISSTIHDYRFFLGKKEIL